jgi:hypothetical protein
MGCCASRDRRPEAQRATEERGRKRATGDAPAVLDDPFGDLAALDEDATAEEERHWEKRTGGVLRNLLLIMISLLSSSLYMNCTTQKKLAHMSATHSPACASACFFFFFFSLKRWLGIFGWYCCFYFFMGLGFTGRSLGERGSRRRLSDDAAEEDR